MRAIPKNEIIKLIKAKKSDVITMKDMDSLFLEFGDEYDAAFGVILENRKRPNALKHLKAISN